MEFGHMEELIFGENSDLFFDENAGEEISDEELNEFGIIETGEEPEVAGYAIALENEQNFNAIMNAMMVKEYACLESTGAELVYTEGAIGDFFEAVKTTIKIWWGKFTEMIKKAQDKIILYTRENGAFIKKYKNKSMKTPSPDTMESKGYLYTNLNKDSSFISLIKADYDSGVDRYITKLRSDFEEEIDTVKKAVETLVSNYDESIKKKVNKHAGTTDKSIADAVKGYYRGEKGVIKVDNFNAIIKEMESAPEIRKKLKKDYDAAKSSMKNMLKTVSDIQGACKKSEDGIDKKRLAASKPVASYIKKALNAMGKIQSISNQVYFEKCKADRAKAMWVINHQPKASNESAGSESDGLGIVLV